MNFREGLNYVYKNHGSEVELTDPFVLHSKLSDLCGSSYQDKQKIELFYKINKRLNVIKSVLSADEDVFSKNIGYG